MNTDRRRLLGASAATALAAFFGGAGRVLASVADVEKAIAEFTGDTAPLEAEGPLSLNMPKIAENGNSVPISFRVESPMTADDHVEAVAIIATENPNPEVATFHFTPISGEARASTRMRLAKTQDVIALARTSTGEHYQLIAHVSVTVGGCGS